MGTTYVSAVGPDHKWRPRDGKGKKVDARIYARQGYQAPTGNVN